MSDNEIQILSEDQKLGSILKEGARVYINPHKCFDGVDLMKAKWQGLQHLALVVKGWSEVDESFTILWARNGKTISMQLTNDESLDIQPFSKNKKAIISIEDDGLTDNIHNASYEYFPVDNPSKIAIRWESTREVELIDLSRVCKDITRRKRCATNLFLVESAVKETAKKSRRQGQKKVLPSNDVCSSSKSDSDEDDNDVVFSSSKSLDSDEDKNEKQLLSCKGSLRKSCKNYDEQSSSEGSSDETHDGGRKLDMDSISSDDKSTETKGCAQIGGFSVTNRHHMGQFFPKYFKSVCKSMWDKKVGSEEYKEVVTDMITLLQEHLSVKDHSTIYSVKRPLHESSTESAETKNDGNMGIIYKLAKSHGFSDAQVDELFAELEQDEHGYFSIDEAVAQANKIKNLSNCVYSVYGGSERKPILPFIEHLGSRVKRVFEDGKEYEGTIASVHFRVAYDDGDTETLTQDEVHQSLVCKEKLHSSEYERHNMLELFSGCSLLSTTCRRKGMNAISVDNDLDSNATMKNDYYHKDVQDVLTNVVMDYIHASPVCSTYSHLAGNLHRDRDNYNKSLQSHKADEILLHMYLKFKHQLQMNPDCIITIENPRGWMRKGNTMKKGFEDDLNFKMYQIFYCQFGRDEMKPTCIWTNDHELGDILHTIGGKCTCCGNHKDGVRQSAGTNFAALPQELCNIIAGHVHSKLTQLKLKKLTATKGGKIEDNNKQRDVSDEPESSSSDE